MCKYQNYHGNNYYHHQYFFPPYAQNVVFVGRKKSVKLPELGGGCGEGVIRAMPELKSFYSLDVFPYLTIKSDSGQHSQFLRCLNSFFFILTF